jgi:methyltransferase-like protein
MGTDPEIVTPYDKVLYPAGVFPQTHPNRLATVGFLRGVNPAPVDRCRVLELGCSVGSNLVAMAFQLPGSEFVGLDLAQRPIAAGQRFIAELGLRNIALFPIDLSDATLEQFGAFDFIIAHGLYSWVPQPVRERILAICREMLSPQGIAYISYNAYPGNHLRDLVRGMMRFHTIHTEDLSEKVGQARGLLKFLAESKPKPDYYTSAIKEQFERTVKYPDEAFFHDDLSEVNQPFYFFEFMADATRHDLKFVGEASSNDLEPNHFIPEVSRKMEELEGAPEIVLEQYKDFIRGCAFRQTLLCHKELELAPDLLIGRIPDVYAMCDAVPVEEGNDPNNTETIFRRRGGSELSSGNPLVCAALKYICLHWPRSVPFRAALEAASAALARDGLRSGDDEPEATLAAGFAMAFRAGFLHLNVFPFKTAGQVSERPSTSALARFQLQRGPSATSQFHVSMKFPDPVSRQLVLLLDGTRDQSMLVQELTEFVRSGQGTLSENGTSVEDPEAIELLLTKRVREGLVSLLQEGMLER